MATEFEREIPDVLTDIRHGCSLDHAGLLLQNTGTAPTSAEQMGVLFRDLPEAIAVSGELSDRLTFQMKDMGYEFPRYPVPEGERMNSFLPQAHLRGCVTTLWRKSKREAPGQSRQAGCYGTGAYRQTKTCRVLFIVWDNVEFCRKHGIFVQGRGSVANSAIYYDLGITAVDPIDMELLFERF